MVFVWVISFLSLLLFFALYPNPFTMLLLGFGGYLIFSQKLIPKPREEHTRVFFYSKDQMEEGGVVTGKLFPQRLKQEGDILIVTGECGPGFYKYFLQASLKVARERSGVIKILTSYPIGSQVSEELFDPRDISQLRTKSHMLYEAIREGVIQLYIVPEKPIRHFGVVNDTTIYLQEPHKHDEPKAQYMKLKSVYLAREYRRYFGELLKTATRVIISENE